ncbi:epoxyqueuosine reductase [Desulfonema ishimotonii]|uniref:Epoxyqueuosine reductase n=1 Tax=Desulfonema ishimotonii TaxID=45657 RepID=A0A401FUZ9_9BACT|nr:epoxyqueuosine reductase [Desulfonema ishimotonii]GBC60807.1 epoxyqueuosine reductase [Desulfonema ishimotonii]
MSEKNINDLVRLINDKAKAFGADLAGVASVEDLKRSPSHEISEKMPEFNGVGTEDAEGRKCGVVKWPEGARSAIVIAVEHPSEKPEMDWWVTDASVGNTAGNRLLMGTVSKLAAWLEKEQGIQCFKLPYHIERGGVYMKDAAVLAGLGCIGKNNILITPQYGPRLRLRVMLTDADLPSAGAIDFDPCEDCPVFCRMACPQDAFAEQVYVAEEYGQEELPGRSGVYNRLSCNQQMVINESDVEDVKTDKQGKQIKYCRECELACPVGSE